ncbi:hypothetical protein [Roseitranquillus sediminis]|uniref:hypothetical protein n=1 Tax=Roseitranquillus sediminis TaxID=2809051 RepID=UPI001D0BFA93|nr:hypothetical protein [Roseitranquillus sediminis]MBM9593274.1 hypothetical protein [Roseitranquillus sediminis]
MPTITSDARVARAILAANRPVPFGKSPPSPERMARHLTLDVWYDPEHLFCPTAGVLVYRAIDDDGHFCWLVRRGNGRDAVSRAVSPYDTVPSDTGANDPFPPAPAAVAELATLLRRTEVRLDLVPGDFYGIHGLAAALGRRGMPGWAAAWLMPLMPEMGRAIWRAHRRSLETRQARLALVASTLLTA